MAAVVDDLLHRLRAFCRSIEQPNEYEYECDLELQGDGRSMPRNFH